MEMKHITGKWNKDEIENTLEDVDFKIKYLHYTFCLILTEKKYTFLNASDCLFVATNLCILQDKKCFEIQKEELSSANQTHLIRRLVAQQLWPIS